VNYTDICKLGYRNIQLS